jgi:hypothetical protein
MGKKNCGKVPHFGQTRMINIPTGIISLSMDDSGWIYYCDDL